MLKISTLIFILTVYITPSIAYSESQANDFSPIQYERVKYNEETHISRGGQLYDNWWKTKVDTDKPKKDHPLWKTQNSNKRSGYATYRCKECHGWDYRGKDGAYGKGSHYTGFPGVYETADKMSVKELKETLKGSTNKDHDFSRYLNKDDISDLALFLKYGTIDLTELLNTDGSPTRGDMDKGPMFFARNCMTECHGPKGRGINFGTREEPEFVGTIAKKNPWEFIHKVRAGQPGTRMSSGIINQWSTQDIMSLLQYSQSLPRVMPETGFFDRMLSRIGLGKKKHKEYIHKEYRGFGPKQEP